MENQFSPKDTHNVKFDLNQEEMELYEALSDYVRTQFNRALG